ncbi:hypothetical protein [Actinoplanes sp. NPDC049599]|uniref:hypothetical protein n=1 Tax=Actinoplanes sp. NPDC049599 TaxID=3363903 RepID=UPI0037AA0DC2
MSKLWSTARRVLRTMLARSRRSAAVTAAVMTTALAGSLGVVGSAAPAYADEPGLFCTIASTGTISAPSPANYGQFVTVQWNIVPQYCPAPVAYIVGPGFGGAGEWISLGGSRQVRAVTSGSTITWSLYLYDMQTGSQQTVQLARRTITVN